MLNNDIVALGGLFASGKDVIADVLVEDYGFVKIGMSDILREALVILNPWVQTPGGDFVRAGSAIQTLGYEAAKEIPEIRSLLQTLGTDVVRNLIDNDAWVVAILKRIHSYGPSGTPIVITGIRYPNEVRAMHSVNAKMVWVDRPDYIRPATATGHTSENSVSEDDFDITIVNDSDLEALEATVREWWES